MSGTQPSGGPLWSGRTSEPTSDTLRQLNDSLSFDRRLYAEDIRGSRAHVAMLAQVGLVTREEADEICEALDRVEGEFERGEFEVQADDEDIHTAVERRATELCGAAAKMHAGRSRNDQVATDLRLWCKRAADETTAQLLSLADAICARATQALADDVYLPGYTHLQRAQPVSLAHHLAAWVHMLLRDIDRLAAARNAADVSPLGAGALAGSTLGIDPHVTASELGFSRVFANSLDAVADRDFVAELLFALAMVANHLSRIGEELVLWCSSEFGFVTLADAHATGSSMMPQKKNPDVAELARAKAGRLLGNLTGFLATMKALPLAYNKDAQEDKEPLFDSFDTIMRLTAALGGVIVTAQFNRDAMVAAARSAFNATTDLAEWMVAHGVPFRDAHETVARLVNDALKANGEVADADAEQHLARAAIAHEDLGPEAAQLLAPGAAYRSRDTHGSGGPAAVATQLADLRERLAAARGAQAELR